MQRLCVSVLLVVVVAGGCGDCGAPPGEVDEPTGGDVADASPVDGDLETPRDGATANDGVGSDGNATDALGDSGAVDSTDGAGDDAETTTCESNEECDGGQLCTEGECTCPRYHRRCGGECVPLHVGADDCGACGRECTGEQACSAGTCSSECLSGREACGNACVDRDTDNRHCGGCFESCDEGEGCVDGTCEPVVSLGDAPAKCSDGGPQIEVPFDEGTDRRCLGDVAQRTFRWAICSCDDLHFGNKLEADAYDSTLGRYEPGGLGGSIGTNGYFHATDQTHIWGGAWTSSSEGIRFENKTTVELDLHSGGDASFKNETTVFGDGYVEGDVYGDGDVEFDQTLFVDNGSQVGDNATYGQLDRSGVEVPTVCERCQEPQQIPVDSIVASHAGSNNDNDAIGLDSEVLVEPGERTSLELPCGEYYLSGIDTERKLTILAEGRTALYIDGDVWAKNKISIVPAPDAELDVFIAGDVELENDATIGSAAYPAAMRFYVGGDRGWIAHNKLQIGAYIYALPGGVRVDNRLDLYGGLYTQNLEAENDVFVHYDRSVLGAGKNCGGPDIPPSNPGADAGGMDGGSTPGDAAVAPDGGGDGDPPDELCRERDESCEENGDCCSPLVCGPEGTCEATRCKNLYESCESGGECCSGTCAESGERAVCISS